MSYREERDRYREEQPIFCGNFEYDASPRDVERLFDQFGRVTRVDCKTGFAFVYMADRKDGEDAIRALDGTEFGNRRRRLRVEWSKGDGEIKQRENRRRPNLIPTTSLFVVNFDIQNTRERDIEDHFKPYGRLTRVQVKRNYCFVEFETVAEATEALEACNNSRFNGRTLTVEYVSHAADGRKSDGPPSRRRSPSPRGRESPRYGRGRDHGRSRSRSRRRSPTPRRDRRRSPSVDSRSPSRGSRSPSRSRS